jgi:protein-S-isoprenylcysteine O-methyltransferase Ste14
MNKKTKLILATLLVYGIPVILWSMLPFSKNLWGTWTDSTIFNFISYGNSVFRPIGIITDVILLYCLFILFFKKDIDFQKERVWLIYSGAKKIFKWIFTDKMRKDSEVSREEKISMLFYLVKLYFAPVMLNFLIGNWQSLSGSISTLNSMGAFTMDEKNILKIYFPAILHVMLVIDTIIFSCGYLFESSRLKNIVKSVEPTALGWLVTLACYPPVNDLTGRVLGWYTSDFSTFSSTNTTIIMGIVSLLLFSVYVWASIVLGFKASNLTNRGIVTKGPYKYVRHPAYASKGISWLIMGIPFIIKFGMVAIISLLGWTIIYFLRALTEERHLSKDPDYVAYSQKVKYMFIPGII